VIVENSVHASPKLQPIAVTNTHTHTHTHKGVSANLVMATRTAYLHQNSRTAREKVTMSFRKRWGTMPFRTKLSQGGTPCFREDAQQAGSSQDDQ
jgi:hypothetical protein